MPAEPPVTYSEAVQGRRRAWFVPVGILLAVLFVLGLVTAGLAVYGVQRLTLNEAAVEAKDLDHFEHGSIGAEPESGLPFWVWQALPRLFPEAFNGRLDYSAFGFLYRKDKSGNQEDLPIGLARRNYRGIDLVWFNCAVCHTGTWRSADGAERHVVAGMPSNNLDLYRFVRFLLNAGADERLNPDRLMPAMEEAGAKFGPLDRLVWTYYVIPRIREGLVQRRSRLYGLLAEDPAWGPGRVDTFNPYKLGQMHMLLGALSPDERTGVSDFPSIFNQKPRDGMQLHWDGNNNSLAERNLSAAIGAGVTPGTVDHAAIERVAAWLQDLHPPPSPHRVDADAAMRGKAIYMAACVECHGYQDKDGYVFRGPKLGRVDPIGDIGTDRGRLDAYTAAFRDRQLAELFAGTSYHFTHFIKTDGYANLPLDGLWLRGPYLHNGSVPTLRDLLSPPEARPAAFLRGLDVVDGANGGFIAPPCDPALPQPHGFCFDSRLPGNGNGGHVYGTQLSAADKEDLLAYLLTF